MQNALRFSNDRFNHIEVKENYKNDHCHGEDLARWLCGELDTRGCPTLSIDQEDWGWLCHVACGENSYALMFGWISAPDNHWQIVTERNVGFWKRLFGSSERGNVEEITTIINEIVRSGTDNTHIRWLRIDSSGNESEENELLNVCRQVTTDEERIEN
ncbi:MAG: hypothetical protein HQM09_07905 [Candidatus Riflebacteria bacterium]|nr:hypothetical protein [Candidatus Riflebacteria bacterium]